MRERFYFHAALYSKEDKASDLVMEDWELAPGRIRDDIDNGAESK